MKLMTTYLAGAGGSILSKIAEILRSFGGNYLVLLQASIKVLH